MIKHVVASLNESDARKFLAEHGGSKLGDKLRFDATEDDAREFLRLSVEAYRRGEMLIHPSTARLFLARPDWMFRIDRE